MAANATSCSSQPVFQGWNMVRGRILISEGEIIKENSTIAELQEIADKILQGYQTVVLSEYQKRDLSLFFFQVRAVEIFSAKVSGCCYGNLPKKIMDTLLAWERNKGSLLRTCREILKNEVKITKNVHERLLKHYEKAMAVYMKSRTKKSFFELQEIRSKVTVQVKSRWKELQNYDKDLYLFFYEEKIIDAAEQIFIQRLETLNEQLADFQINAK